MSDKTLLQKVTDALTEQFGQQAMIDFKTQFGEVAAQNHAAVAYQIRALKTQGAKFQPTRNHL